MGADQDVAPLLALLTGELAAEYERVPPRLRGLIYAALLAAWEAGGIAADPPTVPTGKTPLPPLPRGVTED